MADATRPRERRLADVVREMKIRDADRLDAAERDNEVARGRLELLADELDGVFEEAGGEEEGFDFSISHGPAPRLWVDAATHVSVAADGETFRVLRDGRGGRTVLAETDDVDEAADAVTRYVATRSLERERLFDAAATPEALPRGARAAPFGTAPAQPVGSVEARRPSRVSRLARGIVWFVLGMLAGAGLLFLAFGERLGYSNPIPPDYRFYEPYLPAPGGVAVPGAAVPGTDGADGVAVSPDAGGADVDAPDGDAPDVDALDVEVTTVPVEPVERPAASQNAPANDGAEEDAPANDGAEEDAATN